MIAEFRAAKKRIVLIAALGFSVYLPAFFIPFLWDDFGIIVNNPLIKNFKDFLRIFTTGIFYAELPAKNFYRPVQALSNMFDFHIWGNNPFGYHLTNICLHIICATLLYYLFSRLFKKELAAFLSACLFVVHPVNVEAVGYISGRADPLVLLFLLLSFINYINFRIRAEKRSFIYSGLFFTLAIYSKELAIAAILVYPLIDYILGKNRAYKCYFLFVLLTAVFLISRFLVLGFAVAQNKFNVYVRLLTFSAGLFDYLKILIIPANLHMSYTTTIFSHINSQLLLRLGASATLIILVCYVLRREKKLPVFSFSWFFIFLIPQSGVFPINAYFAEHFIYLSEYALFFVVILALREIFKNKRLVFYSIFTMFILFLSFESFSYMRVWSDPVKFYRWIIINSPNSFAAYNNLGDALEKKGLRDEARKLYLKALSINPGYVLAYNNLGESFLNQGQLDKAILIFRQAIEKEPEKPVLHYNLATAYDQSGDEPAALAEYEKAFSLAERIAPWDSSVHFKLGLVFYKTNRNDEAKYEFKKAIALNPDDPAAYVNLGLVYKAMGKFEDAVDEYRKALGLDPKFAQAYNNLGVIYALAQDRDSALDYFSRALQIDAKFDEARFNLGLLYLEKRDFNEGRRELNLISENSKLYSLAQEELKRYKLKDKNKKH